MREDHAAVSRTRDRSAAAAGARSRRSSSRASASSRTASPWRALAFAGGALALLVAFARRVWLETQARLPDDPSALLDPAWPFRLADEIHRANASFFFWITARARVRLGRRRSLDAWHGARGAAAGRRREP